MSGYFITATGTDVGKTFTTLSLIHAAKQANKPVRAYKPIISGWVAGYNSDTEQLMAAQNRSRDEISPWRFAAPLSPQRAAAIEKKNIAFDRVVDWSKMQMSGPGLVLMEGVGGVMVPLTEEKTVIDWMVALALPVIVVTGSYLGNISHTLTALQALKHAGLGVKALVVNETAGSEVPLEEAKAGLFPFIDPTILTVIQPRVALPSAATEIHELLKDLV